MQCLRRSKTLWHWHRCWSITTLQRSSLSNVMQVKVTWGCHHTKQATHKVCKSCLERPRDSISTISKGDASCGVCTSEIWSICLWSPSNSPEWPQAPCSHLGQTTIMCAPKTLQRMLLKVQKYNVSIIYKPGQEMYLTDTLSYTQPILWSSIRCRNFRRALRLYGSILNV